MKPEAKAKDPRFRFLQKREFRQALSHAVDREELAGRSSSAGGSGLGTDHARQQAVVLAQRAALPARRARARELLKAIGLEDRNKNGIVEDAAGTEARFTVLTQRGITYYESGTMVLRETRRRPASSWTSCRWSRARCSSGWSPVTTTPSTCVRS